MSVRFLNLKFLYIVIVNSVFYGIMRYLDIWEFLTQFAKSFLFDSCVLFALCALVANLPRKIATKALNLTLNTLFAISFVVGIVNIFLLLNFNFTLNIASFEIFLASNLREAGEFGAFYANAKSIIALVLFSAISAFCAFFKRTIPTPKIISRVIILTTIAFLCVGIAKFAKSKNLNFLATHFVNKSEICQFASVIYKGFVAEGAIIAEFRAMDEKLNSTLERIQSAQRLTHESRKITNGGGKTSLIPRHISRKLARFHALS